MIPVDIVSGYLGAGKTTLLRRLLADGLGGARLAVVVNEIGEIGIDGKVVSGLGFAERMVELSSGCICCQLDTVHFEIALEELCEAVEPDRVVIETTGVADPGALSARLGELGHHLGAVVTVADTLNLKAVLSEPVGRAQVAAADYLVLSKLDAGGPWTRSEAEAALRPVSPRAVVVTAPVGGADLHLLFGGAMSRTALPGTPPMETDMETLTWTSQVPLARRPTLDLLGALPAEIYRAKGVVRFAEASVPAIVDVTAGRLSTQWEPTLAAEPNTTLVFIGRDAASWRDNLLAALRGSRAS